MAVSSTHRLSAVGRHDTARVLAFLGAHAVPGVETWDGVTWTTSLRLPSGPGVAAVRTAADGDRPGADVQLALTAASDETVALQRLRSALDLDADVGDAERHLADDALLGPLVVRRPGLRLPGTTDPWETLARTVIGQQVSVAGARTVTAALVQAVGDRLPDDVAQAGVTHLFPSPSSVAALPPDTTALRMPRSRARAVVAAAEAFTQAALPTREQLLALTGVGAWTADYFDARARGDRDVLLTTDLAVRRAVERLGHDGSPAAVRELGRRWAPYRSLAMVHLWAEYLAL
ncbi:MAG: DNA-3-methyladenine glycosylase family protein [Angustibacter sp.]